MKYASYVDNYKTIAEAEAYFVKLNSDAVLEKHNDGSACIVFLRDTPLYPSQVAYAGRGKGK